MKNKTMKTNGGRSGTASVKKGRDKRKQIPTNNLKRKFKPFKFGHGFKMMPSVLNAICNKFTREEYLEMITFFKRKIELIINTQGVAHGMKYYKAVRSQTLQVVEGRNPTNPDKLAVGKRDKIPMKLSKLKPLIFLARDGDDKAYQALQTILYSTRILEIPTEPDYNQITEGIESVNPEIIKEFRTYVRNRLDSMPDFKKPSFDFYVKLNLSNSTNGPNRKGRLDSAYQEAKALARSELFQPFKDLCSYMGLSGVPLYIEQINDDFNSFNDKTLLRNLIVVPDSDCKSRIVAVSDFWTQLVLVPLEKAVIKFTKVNFGSSSGYDDHLGGFRKLQQFIKENPDSDVKSYDMTNWTDRFHHDLQKVLMEELFNRGIADNWFKLVVSCKWNVCHTKNQIKYKQGQGMGTHGSFQIATLTDHFFIEMNMQKHYPDFKPSWYNKTGDDLWINDPKNIIPDCYNNINLDVNMSKSKYKTDRGYFGEYVSRTTINGEDVSRINPKCIQNSKDWREVPILLHTLERASVELKADNLNLNDLRTKTGLSYLSLLSNVLYISQIIEEHKEIEDKNYRPLRVSKDYLERNGFMEHVSIPKTDDAKGIFSIARTLFVMAEALVPLKEMQGRLITNTKVPIMGYLVTEMVESSSYSVFDPDNSLYQDFAGLSAITSYPTRSSQYGGRVIAPKSLMAIHARSADMKISDISGDLAWSKKDPLLVADELSDLSESISYTSLKTFKGGDSNRFRRNVLINLKILGMIDFDKRSITFPDKLFKTLNDFSSTKRLMDNFIKNNEGLVICCTSSPVEHNSGSAKTVSPTLQE